MKTTNVILGMAAAAVVGAAIGMLLAPEKGSALQKKIKDEANKWMDEVKKLVSAANDTEEVAEEEVKKIKSNLKPIVEN
ncbi:MAG: YtxH domain-containing protein [Bacteroidota bacterium]